MFGREEFWESFILNLQTDRTAVDTECLGMVKEMHGIMTESEVYYSSKKYYEDSMKEKGKSNGGTETGHWMHSITKYTDAAIKGFDVYHSCRIDYYFQSLGK